MLKSNQLEITKIHLNFDKNFVQHVQTSYSPCIKTLVLQLKESNHQYEFVLLYFRFLVVKPYYLFISLSQ